MPSSTVTNYQDKYLTVTLDPERRDRAWDIIVRLAKKKCILVRIDDTSFTVTPQAAYDLTFCLSVVAVAIIASEDIDIKYFWMIESARRNMVSIFTRYNCNNIAHIRLSESKLQMLADQLIKQYASETIDQLIKDLERQIFDESAAVDLIEELRQGYRKLKFHQHDFWYRHFGGLGRDLGEIESCIADAILVADAIKVFNMSVIVTTEQYKYSLGKKWNAEQVPGEPIFELDTDTLKAEAHRKKLARDAAKFTEKLAQISNRAIRLFPI